MLGFDQPDYQLQQHHVSGAEVLLGITFPDAYKKLVTEYGGAYGDAEFDVEQPSPGFETCGIGLLLSLDPCSAVSIWSRMLTWGEQALDPIVIPFGQDGGGNYICFDFREGEDPKIVFCFHELQGNEGIMAVCSSFDRFLLSLRLPTDEA